MGWWKVQKREDCHIGDEPLDILGDAALAVVEEYKKQYGRKPRREEWEALLSALLSPGDPDDDRMRLFEDVAGASSVSIVGDAS